MTIPIEELEKLALALTEAERARLAASILYSLPAVLKDSDEGITEALRRDKELSAHPERAISFEQLDAAVRDRRG
jgi:hypothetical protein